MAPRTRSSGGIVWALGLRFTVLVVVIVVNSIAVVIIELPRNSFELVVTAAVVVMATCCD